MKIDKKKLAVIMGLVIGISLIGLAAGINQSSSPIVIDTEAENLEVTIYKIQKNLI